jgi:hypothetical protein
VRQNTSKPTIRNVSLREINKDNAIRVVNFATQKNLIVKSKMLPHHNIHKYPWTSPDGKTHNQIDYILLTDKAFKYSCCLKAFKYSWCLIFWIKEGIQIQLMSDLLELLTVILSITW